MRSPAARSALATPLPIIFAPFFAASDAFSFVLAIAVELVEGRPASASSRVPEEDTACVADAGADADAGGGIAGGPGAGCGRGCGRGCGFLCPYCDARLFVPDSIPPLL